MRQNWLRTLREQARLTQEDLTARLQVEGFDISRSAVASWEHGRHIPPLHDANFRQALSKALNIKPRLILKLAGFEVEEESHSLLAEQAATLIDQLPEDRKELALRLIEQLAKV